MYYSRSAFWKLGFMAAAILGVLLLTTANSIYTFIGGRLQVSNAAEIMADGHHPGLSSVHPPGQGVYSNNHTAVHGFDVRHVRLEFLPEFKNPCWLEPYSNADVYEKNRFFSTTEYYPKRIWKSQFGNLPAGGVMYENHTLGRAQGKCRLRCLPYFMLLGVHKSGSTDFYQRTDTHPQIFSSIEKEVYWWNQLRFEVMLGASLGDYADLFDNSVGKILNYKFRNPGTGRFFYPSILGEYTAMTFFDMSYWRDDQMNKGLTEPMVTTPFDIHKINPNVKLIVLLRNPTARLYSHYNSFSTHKSPEDFHLRILGSIWWWNTCTAVKGLPRRNCAYGSPPEMPAVYDGLGKPHMWWHARYNYSGEIRTSMYSVHAREWMRVFPRDSFLFIKMEEYSLDITKAYRDQIFPFLEVEQPCEEMMKNISVQADSSSRSYEPMWTSTQQLLDEFYRPFNEELAEILGDDKWLWNDVH